MKINTVFFGASPYSTIVLKKLATLTDFPIVSVVSKTDKAVGRHLSVLANPVSLLAQKLKLPLLKTDQFDQNFIKKFKDLKPDLALVVAYGPPFFTPDMLDIPRFKIINIHPSPLPRYRGATPGPWQIINGETDSAVSFFQLDPLPDHGPLLAQIPLSISATDTADTFYQKAFHLATDNLEKTLLNYIKNPQKLIPQNHSQKTYFPKFTKLNAQINWTWPKPKIERFVRALLPWPVAWTYVQNQSGLKLKMKMFPDNIVQIEDKTKTSWPEIEKYYTIIDK
ncbi:methionyl-tRNA formyltransferase [Patescibacteria group bacterium]|nr:methionyl-tRNA formyltransferase [Patescibacteria group bacterium]